ncbi:MAG: EutN/CcmL family microcompartment protein [Spirochaetaceae bacterium]|nr:EutN/CcmL family microcompartment protein [Spirochaetaceae bacterium]
MTLCRVVGNVVSTVKHPVLTGHKLMVCKPVDPASGKLRGSRVVAVDTVQAGIGDMVLVIDEGNAARKILGDATAPVRTVIAAIVDRVDQWNDETGEESNE